MTDSPSHSVSRVAMADAQFQKLFDLIDRINAHEVLESVLEEDEDTDTRWLPMDNIANGFVDVPEDFKVLMEELAGELGDLMITSDGQHSKAFYAVRQYGFKTRTGERDSFGPLTSVFVDRLSKWQVCYG